jgi:hypothetical protein
MALRVPVREDGSVDGDLDAVVLLLGIPDFRRRALDGP